MENHEIAVFIRYFNIILTTALAFFAVFGVIRILAGNSFLNIVRNRIFLQAFCVAALAAFALEATVFNFPHYLKYFADSELATTELSGGRLMTSEAGYTAEIVSKDGASGIRFKNIDRRVTSIFADMEFTSGDVANMRVLWTDEESTRGYMKKIYRNMPHENYALLQPCGKVSELEVIFDNVDQSTNINIVQVVLNKPIPFYFSGLRLIVVSLLILAVLVVCRRELRAKMSYLLFEYRFNPASKKQNVIYGLSVILLIFFSLACVLTSVSNVSSSSPNGQQYNRFLVDALIEGRTWLDYGNPEKLLSAERPYDTRWLAANGYERSVDWMWDCAWYNGKHYCYYGVVPAVILYVPYKMITGNYLSYQAGTFLFVLITIVLLAALYRHCVKRYMPDMRFAFYLLSFMTLFFASGLYALLRGPSVYVIVRSAGLMFAVAGIYLLLKSTEKESVSRVKLFFACLCFALIAGCRPPVAVVSLLVPIVLWKRGLRSLLPVIIVPFVLVAVPLCAYNYVRFDSIFDFGTNYQLTSWNITAYNLMNPFAKAIRILVASASYLFRPVAYTLTFPFADNLPRDSWMVHGSFQYNDTGVGIFCFPVTLCLLWLFFSKARPKAFPIMAALLVSACAVILLESWVVGFVGGYIVDFAVMIILPSIFCAYYWARPVCEEVEGGWGGIKFRLGVVYALLAASAFIGLFLFVSGASVHTYKDPVLYRYLEYSLGLIRVI